MPRPTGGGPATSPLPQHGAVRQVAETRVAQADDGIGLDPVMRLLARDDRQVAAAVGDIDKPGGEMAGIPAELDEVLGASLNVLRRYSRTEEVLEIIQSHIEYYIENARLIIAPDPNEGEELDIGPPLDPRVPHDDTPITQAHIYVIQQFIMRVENHYGGHLHDIQQRKMVENLLHQFCNKIKTIPGCITAIVNMLDNSKLLDLLTHMPHVAKEIKDKLYDTDIMCDKLRLKIKQTTSIEEEQKDMIEKLMIFVLQRLHIEISVRRQDILSFLDDNKMSLELIMQARVALTDSPTSKLDPEKNTKFLRKFDNHIMFQESLQEILSGNSLGGAFSKLHLQEKEPEDKDELKGGSLPGAVGSAFSSAKSGAEGGAISKPGLLAPPPASPETEIPKFSENEIFLRLTSEASAKTAFMICKKYGLITQIKPQMSVPGAFTVTFDEKSGAERAQELKDEKVIRVDRAKLSGSHPLSDIKLYCGELDESKDEDTLRAIGSQYSGLKEVVLRGTPSGQAFGILTYNSSEEAYAARRGLQEADFFVTKAMTRQTVARSLSSDLSAQRPYRPPPPPPGQSPNLYFSKLPGESMQFEECRKFLAGLVSSVLPPGSSIQRTSVTQVKVDGETGMTFRHGFCDLQTLEDCQTVMSKLRGTKSAARGFEDQWLIVNWAKSQTRRL